MTDTDISLDAETFVVSATEKRDIGEYENVTVHSKLEGTIKGVDTADVDAIKDELRERQRMVAATVKRTAQERVDEATGGE